MRIRAKLMLLLVLLGASSVILTAWIGYINARDSVTARVMDQLTSVREAERFEIETYFHNITQQTRALSEDLLSTSAMREFGDAIRVMASGTDQRDLRDDVDIY